MATERKQPKIVYEGTNVILRQDNVEQNDGSLSFFNILTIQSDSEGYFRDEKGNLCYGKRPPKALTFPTDVKVTKQLKEAIGLLK